MRRGRGWLGTYLAKVSLKVFTYSADESNVHIGVDVVELCDKCVLEPVDQDLRAKHHADGEDQSLEKVCKINCGAHLGEVAKHDDYQVQGELKPLSDVYERLQVVKMGGYRHTRAGRDSLFQTF